ncbi:MAG: hypothetical protein R3F49_07725 [Planctomycetota bacterium]
MIDQHTLTPHTPTSAATSQERTDEQRAGGQPEKNEVTLVALQRQFQTIAGEVGELARLIRGSANTAVAVAAEKAEGVRQDTTERAREVEGQAADWIKERPFQASLLSMGLGALLWSVLKRS